MVDEGTTGSRSADAALVARARTGDQQAFAELFDRYAPRIHAFCARVLGDPHTAADATQDTFVTAVRRLDQLRDPGALRPWLYAIARNECTRHGRARDRALPVEDVAVIGGDRPVADDEPARRASAAEVADLLWAAADGLDDRDRALLELQLRHGLEGQELALAAGVAPGQISMATGRMRDRLERAVGALLVARGGRDDCPGLQVVLEGWDGTFSVLMRKRVARHIERCEVCDDRRRVLVAPLGSLAVVPLVVPFALGDLPGGLRAATLDAMGAAAGASPPPPDPWDGDGFPPDEDWEGLEVAEAVGGPAGPEPGTAATVARRRRLAGVLAALVLVVVGVVAVVWSAGDDEPADQAATAVATTEVAGTAAVDEDAAPTSDLGLAEPTSTAADAGAPSTASPELAEPTTTTTAAGPAPTTSVVAAPAPTPPTTAPPATAPPTTAPDAGPTVGPLVRSGSATMQTTCNPANDRRTVSVTVTDDRGVSSVVLRWNHSAAGAGERAMTRSGSTWSATLGPFAEVGSVSFRAVATDTGGHVASTATQVVVVDPCPG